MQVYAIDSTVINLVSEENSMKVSIRDVEMVDGDMFTSRGLDMMMQPDSVLGMVKETCQSVKGSDAPSNYNSSRYKTPLR